MCVLKTMHARGAAECGCMLASEVADVCMPEVQQRVCSAPVAVYAVAHMCAWLRGSKVCAQHQWPCMLLHRCVHGCMAEGQQLIARHR